MFPISYLHHFKKNNLNYCCDGKKINNSQTTSLANATLSSYQTFWSRMLYKKNR